MAKLTKHLCDFCAGPLGDPHAKLTIPIVNPIDAVKPAVKPSVELSFSAMFFGMSSDTERKTRSFDMCRDCADGLTRWRHEAVEALIAAGYVKEPV